MHDETTPPPTDAEDVEAAQENTARVSQLEKILIIFGVVFLALTLLLGLAAFFQYQEVRDTKSRTLADCRAALDRTLRYNASQERLAEAERADTRHTETQRIVRAAIYEEAKLPVTKCDAG